MTLPTQPCFEGLKPFDAQLTALNENDALRQMNTVEARCDGKITIAGQCYWDFSSNDYLGFSQHPAMVKAAVEAVEQYGTSTTSSRLITGSHQLITQLETALCGWLQAPASLVYNSGYQANIGLLTALISPNDTVYCDKLVHASLIDGLKQAGIRFKRFSHLDTTTLGQWLQQPCTGQRWVITESVFSMDGDLADLEKLHDLCKTAGAWLIVDEAHGVGVLGNSRGSGQVETLGLKQWPDFLIVMGTFSKALGSFGAFVAAHPTIIKTLVNTSRALIYSTSLPPAVVAANLTAIQLCQQEPQWRNALHQRIAELNAQLASTPVLGSAIFPFVVGTNEAVLKASTQMKTAGLWAHAIRPPTVPPGQGRLRITLSALHPPEAISQLCKTLISLQ